MPGSAGGQRDAAAAGVKAAPNSQGPDRGLPADPEAAASERRKKERGIGMNHQLDIMYRRSCSGPSRPCCGGVDGAVPCHHSTRF